MRQDPDKVAGGDRARVVSLLLLTCTAPRYLRPDHLKQARDFVISRCCSLAPGQSVYRRASYCAACTYQR
jgi:ABC-type uncharacterized transport system YnjBCD ATPase subunit